MVSLCSAKDMLPSASSPTDFFKRLEGPERVEGTCSVAANAEGEAVKNLTVTVTVETLKEEEQEVLSEKSCCTPTAKDCRIPEVLTCPPAPRKRRPSYSSPLPLRVKETEAEYFSSPNLESIFALGDVYKVKFKH